MASLKQNTIYLYALTASNYLFSLITIPYLTRILGPEQYGNLSFAMAIGVYFSLIFDLGFLLSGTKKVALYNNNIQELSKIFTGVSIIKIVMVVIMMGLILILSKFILELKDNLNLIILFMFVSFFTSLLPDYMYRGLEEMKIIAFRGVSVRAIFTILIFCFLRSSTQIYLVPIFYIIGGLIVLFWVIWDLHKRHGVRIVKIDFNYLKDLLFESLPFFVSRVASSIYNVTNTVILGFFYPGHAVVGFYSSAEKFKTIAAQGCVPISDSFYPYMIRTKNYIRLIKVTILLEIPIIMGCIGLYIWAQPICSFVFGNEYEGAYVLLRWMTPVMCILLPSYMFGFPALTPLNKSKWANISVEIGMFNQIVGLMVLYLTNSISAVNLCILTLISESIVFLIRICCFVVSYKSLRINE